MLWCVCVWIQQSQAFGFHQFCFFDSGTMGIIVVWHFHSTFRSDAAKSMPFKVIYLLFFLVSIDANSAGAKSLNSIGVLTHSMSVFWATLREQCGSTNTRLYEEAIEIECNFRRFQIDYFGDSNLSHQRYRRRRGFTLTRLDHFTWTGHLDQFNLQRNAQHPRAAMKKARVNHACVHPAVPLMWCCRRRCLLTLTT